jgi:hypothetical protein
MFVGEDPRPQAKPPVTTSARNETARWGAYTDQGLTTRNVVPTRAVPVPLPPRSGATTLGGIVVYDVAGTQKTDFDHTNAQAHPPVGWKKGRDFYTNRGLDGEITPVG